jgi:integral membrane protein
MMKKYITTNVGRLRILAFLEGVSLLILIFIAVPLKYIYGNPALVKVVGQIHGILFLLFVVNTLSVGVEQNWKFRTTTLKVLIACVIPFGTFYIDHKILSKIHLEENSNL